MASPVGQPAFPTLKAALALTGAVVGLLVAALLVTRGLAPGDPVVQPSVLFAAGVVWLAALAGLAPVAVLGPRGVMPTVYGYFAGMGLRLVLTLGAAMAAVYTDRLPGRPVAAALAVFYLPLLCIEIAFVGRYLWRKDFLPRPGGRIVLPSSETPAP